MTGLPTSIGRYQVRRELGRGMMGVVYEAHDPDLGRDIALKVIQLALGVGQEERQSFEQRFFAEARTAARLTHAGIVVVHDVGRDAQSGALFMALELLHGDTVESALREHGPFAWRDALRIAQRVAEALHYAHSQRIVHRDVKPANLMLLASGEPKIMDFGIAKLETSQLTATGQFMGTPLYMSPEQALAHPVDGRADLFSLGSVLYEMITGRKAFAGENVTKILFQIMSREPDPPSRLAAGVPEQVDYVLARCLAKDVNRRYPDGKTLAEDLEDIQASQPPRWQAAWQGLGAAGVRTMVAPARQASSPSPQPKPARTPVTPPMPAPWRDDTEGRRSGGSRRWILAGMATLLALAGGFFFLHGDPPVARVVSTPSTEPRREREATPKDEPTAAPADAGSPARLLFDFEHSLKSGTLRVWVDDHLVIDEQVGGHITKKFKGFEMRKGRLSDTLEVAPGRREVKVQVRWEDDVKTQSAWANFKPGATLRLKARLGSLGGIRKDLSLEWD